MERPEEGEGGRSGAPSRADSKIKAARSFPVEEDELFLAVSRYVERNPLPANLMAETADWPWGSLGRAQHGRTPALLDDWPVPRSAGWVACVNEVQSDGALQALRRSLVRGSPFGKGAWVADAVVRLGLEGTLRPRGRLRKKTTKEGRKGS